MYLAGSIILSSYLMLAFKACEKYNINIFQAIIFNYFTCVITGSIVNGSFPITAQSLTTPWFQWAAVMGVLFISIFNIIAITSQKNGIAVASVASKLSLIIPVLISIFLYNDTLSNLNIIGIVLALVAVVLTCYQPSNVISKNNKSLATYALPLILFIGSGLLDALINHVQINHVNSSTQNAFLISGFFSAGTIGSIILIIGFITGKQIFNVKNLIAGIVIGIPNYFSIWCLVNYLKTSSLQSSASIPVNNMGIVLFSTIVAWIVFKEKLSTINWLGILLSVLAILLIAFG
jgi:drug/metabolite transporter (DMT)-like permease